MKSSAHLRIHSPTIYAHTPNRMLLQLVRVPGTPQADCEHVPRNTGPSFLPYVTRGGSGIGTEQAGPGQSDGGGEAGAGSA